jgi:hypothetical protein
MAKKKSAGKIQSAAAPVRPPVLRRKFDQIAAILQDATERQLARLLKQLIDGERTIPPDIELSELEAGILIENLDSHLRRRDRLELCNVIWDRL